MGDNIRVRRSDFVRPFGIAPAWCPRFPERTRPRRWRWPGASPLGSRSRSTWRCEVRTDCRARRPRTRWGRPGCLGPSGTSGEPHWRGHSRPGYCPPALGQRRYGTEHVFPAVVGQIGPQVPGFHHSRPAARRDQVALPRQRRCQQGDLSEAGIVSTGAMAAHDRDDVAARRAGAVNVQVLPQRPIDGPVVKALGKSVHHVRAAPPSAWRNRCRFADPGCGRSPRCGW